MNRRLTIRCAAIGLSLALVSGSSGSGPLCLTYEGSQPLPNVRIDDHAVVIHTQGLFVTDKHFYVTGRLERRPKRALFLAFDRRDPSRYELLDITPDGSVRAPLPTTLPRWSRPSESCSNRQRCGEGKPAKSLGPASPTRERLLPEQLDHPGGFDCDGAAFWIPIGASRPRGPTAIVRLDYLPDVPLDKWTWRIAFRVDDHIGALAWEPASRQLYGANWDTKRVYAWTRDGKQIKNIDRFEWVRGVPDWQLAVQDWKGVRDELPLPPGVLLAGGIDKSPGRDRAKPSAVVEWIDPVRRSRLARIHLSSAPDCDGPVTREGIALHDGRLYLLPGDLGRKARILRYRCQVVQQTPR